MDHDHSYQIPKRIRAVPRADQAQTGTRTIIICLDGTGDKFDADNSNIVHLVSCLKKSDPSQVTYYQSGIGTYNGGGVTNGFKAALDMAVGSGLGVHVYDGYQFLMQNYQQGDKICLFGFSRGAYTARCLAGMVHKVGLLPAHNRAQIPFAYEYYSDDSKKGWQMSKDFKKTFCVDINIHFVGVFDSVASVGVIPRQLPLSSTPENKALYFRHAIALDERRAKFKACRFQQKDTIDDEEWKLKTGDAPDESNDGKWLQHEKHELPMQPSTDTGTPEETNVKEVWFAGCHCDVGGGAVKNEVRHKLSQIPLRWMIRQCFECDTGIIFKTERLAEEGLDVNTLYPVYTRPGRPDTKVRDDLLQEFQQSAAAPVHERSAVLKPVSGDNVSGQYKINIWQDKEQRKMATGWTPEQVEDLFDAVEPATDQLKSAKVWWILELFPIQVLVRHKTSSEWVYKRRMNLGRPRAVYEKAPKLHWTVEERMRLKQYALQIRYDQSRSLWKSVE